MTEPFEPPPEDGEPQREADLGADKGVQAQQGAQEPALDISSLPLKKPAGQAYEDPVELHATELMGRTKAGDQAAFDQLVETLRGRAFRQARSLVGSHEDALDLCQEAFLKTYRSRESFREDQAFLPWFQRILRNTCFSFLRKRKHRRALSLSGTSTGDDGNDDGDWVLPDDGPPPSHRVEADERSEIFWQVLALLKAKDREILSLRHFEDLSYRELARVLEIPEGTVMSRLYHARRRLRDELAKTSLAEEFLP